MIHLGLGQPDFKTLNISWKQQKLDDGHHGYVLSNGILVQTSCN